MRGCVRVCICVSVFVCIYVYVCVCVCSNPRLPLVVSSQIFLLWADRHTDGVDGAGFIQGLEASPHNVGTTHKSLNPMTIMMQ